MTADPQKVHEGDAQGLVATAMGVTEGMLKQRNR